MTSNRTLGGKLTHGNAERKRRDPAGQSLTGSGRFIGPNKRSRLVCCDMNSLGVQCEFLSPLTCDFEEPDYFWRESTDRLKS